MILVSKSRNPKIQKKIPDLSNLAAAFSGIKQSPNMQPNLKSFGSDDGIQFSP